MDEANIKIYKFLVVFLWIFSIAGVLFYYLRAPECSSSALSCQSPQADGGADFRAGPEGITDINLSPNRDGSKLDLR